MPTIYDGFWDSLALDSLNSGFPRGRHNGPRMPWVAYWGCSICLVSPFSDRPQSVHGLRPTTDVSPQRELLIIVDWFPWPWYASRFNDPPDPSWTSIQRYKVQCSLIMSCFLSADIYTNNQPTKRLHKHACHVVSKPHMAPITLSYILWFMYFISRISFVFNREDLKLYGPNKCLTSRISHGPNIDF